MIKGKTIIIIKMIAILLLSCKSGGIKDKIFRQYKKSEKYNFIFIGSDINVNNPDMDKRSYYKIYIDKLEEGRTTIGLESQYKIFKTKLSINRHLLNVQKWILDEKEGRYIKLNNIDQPKPNYYYFTIPKDRVVIIKMKTDKNNFTIFDKEFELE